MRRRPSFVFEAVISIVFVTLASAPVLLIAHEDGDEDHVSEHQLQEMEQMRRKIEREDRHRQKSAAKVQRAEPVAQTPPDSGAALPAPVRSEEASQPAPSSSPSIFVYLFGSTLAVVGGVFFLRRRGSHAAKSR